MSKTGKCRGMELYTNIAIPMVFNWISNVNMTVDEWLQVGGLTAWLFTTEHISQCKGYVITKIEPSGYIMQVYMVLEYAKTSFQHEVDNFIDHLQSRHVTLYIEDQSALVQIRLQLVHNMSFTGNSSLINPDFSFGNDAEHLHKRRCNDESVDENNFRMHVFDDICYVGAVFDNSKLLIKYMLATARVSSVRGVPIPKVITYTCFSLSILALLVLIIIQRKHGLVTNIPSSNTENISVSLLFSNLLFMFGADAYENRHVCYTVGVCLHYLWLTVFTFMSISVFCITTTLTKMQARRVAGSYNDDKRKFYYRILGLAIPIPFVVPTICLDIFGPNKWSAGYGQSPCFPNIYPANLVFFTGPIVCSVVTSLFCLTYIISKVCIIRVEASHIRKLNPYTEATIYFRIVILSNVLWGFGILNALYDEEWVSYAFTVLCGLHGFFISVANLTSSRFKCRNEASIDSGPN